MIGPIWGAGQGDAGRKAGWADRELICPIAGGRSGGCGRWGGKAGGKRVGGPGAW